MSIVPHRSHAEVRRIRVRDLGQRRVEDELYCRHQVRSAFGNTFSKATLQELTSPVNSWDEIEAVRRKTSRVVLEEADGTRGVIEPCESRDTTFCGECEREVVARR